MAETTKRSDLIRQQLQKLIDSAPPPVSQAEREKIMSKRKGQTSIDEGRAAIKAREEEVRLHNEAVERITGQLGEAETGEGTAAEKAKREESSDPLMNKIVPGAIGAAAGSGVTYGLNKIVGAGDASNANALIEIGDEIGPTEKLTNSQMNRSRAVGAAAAADQFAPKSKLAKALNFGGRVGTYAVPIGFIANEYQKYQKQADDKSLPWEEQQAAQRMANGFLGGFTGIGLEGAARFFNKKTPEGVGKAMMRINTARDYAKRMDESDARPRAASSPLARALTEEPRAKSFPKTIDAEILPEPAPQKALPAPETTPETPPKAAATPGTAAYMRERLKDDFGITGTSKMKKGQLATKLAEAMQEHGAKRTVGPRKPGGGGTAAGVAAVLGGGLAADAAYNSARAEGASPMQAIGNAAPAAATTAGGVGAGYGVSKLAQALSPIAGKAIGMGSSMLGPMMAGDMTDMSADEAAQARQQIAAVPGQLRSALSSAMTPGNATPEETQGAMYPEAVPPQAAAPQPAPPPQQNPMMSASALQIPENIPPDAAQQAEIAAAFSPNVEGRLRRMVSLGAPPEAIAQFLNQATAR
jgi:hypothetical protein